MPAILFIELPVFFFSSPTNPVPLVFNLSHGNRLAQRRDCVSFQVVFL